MKQQTKQKLDIFYQIFVLFFFDLFCCCCIVFGWLVEESKRFNDGVCWRNCCNFCKPQLLLLLLFQRRLFCRLFGLATVLDEIVAQLFDDGRSLAWLNRFVVFANDDALNRLDQNNTTSTLRKKKNIGSFNIKTIIFCENWRKKTKPFCHKLIVCQLECRGV